MYKTALIATICLLAAGKPSALIWEYNTSNEREMVIKRTVQKDLRLPYDERHKVARYDASVYYKCESGIAMKYNVKTGEVVEIKSGCYLDVPEGKSRLPRFL